MGFVVPGFGELEERSGSVLEEKGEGKVVGRLAVAGLGRGKAARGRKKSTGTDVWGAGLVLFFF